MILLVYAANLLAQEVCAADKRTSPPEFDLEYLNEGGALELLPRWRELADAAYFTEAPLVG